MIELKIYKTHPMVTLPKFATTESACFDIQVCTHGKTTYSGFNASNKPIERPINNNEVCVMPGDRMMIPTGMILDIPEGYSVRLHPRSGLSLKQGLVLANCEAVIDSDYFSELFLLLANMSDTRMVIKSGERVAQAELVPQLKYSIAETGLKPVQRSNRVGGLGSTGINTMNFVYKTEEKTEEPVKRGRGRPRKESNG